MKNIRSQRKFTEITKNIGLSLIMFVVNFSYVMLASDQASANLYTTADMLTKASYHAPEKQNAIILLMNDQSMDATKQNIPSVEEIIIRVCNLQNAQGVITNKKTKTKALDALHAAIQATDNALLLARLQIKNKDLEHVIPSTIDHKLIKFLNNQKERLQKKIVELDKKTIWSYFSKSSIPYIAAGITVAILTTGIGTAYYYGYFDSPHAMHPLIFTGAPFNEKREANYAEIKHWLKKYLDPQDKDPLSIYIDEAKKLKKQFDPIADRTIIEVLDTVIEADTRQEIHFKNVPFWFDVCMRRNHYTNVFNEIVHHNNPDATKKLNFDDLDFKQLWRDKGWM